MTIEEQHIKTAERLKTNIGDLMFKIAQLEIQVQALTEEIAILKKSEA